MSSGVDAPPSQEVSQAITFLQHPKTQATPVAERIAFLQSKGVSAPSITEALAKCGLTAEKPTAIDARSRWWRPLALGGAVLAGGALACAPSAVTAFRGPAAEELQAAAAAAAAAAEQRAQLEELATLTTELAQRHERRTAELESDLRRHASTAAGAATAATTQQQILTELVTQLSSLRDEQEASEERVGARVRDVLKEQLEHIVKRAVAEALTAGATAGEEAKEGGGTLELASAVAATAGMATAEVPGTAGEGEDDDLWSAVRADWALDRGTNEASSVEEVQARNAAAMEAAMAAAGEELAGGAGEGSTTTGAGQAEGGESGAVLPASTAQDIAVRAPAALPTAASPVRLPPAAEATAISATVASPSEAATSLSGAASAPSEPSTLASANSTESRKAGKQPVRGGKQAARNHAGTGSSRPAPPLSTALSAEAGGAVGALPAAEAGSASTVGAAVAATSADCASTEESPAETQRSPVDGEGDSTAEAAAPPPSAAAPPNFAEVMKLVQQGKEASLPHTGIIDDTPVGLPGANGLPEAASLNSRCVPPSSAAGVSVPASSVGVSSAVVDAAEAADLGSQPAMAPRPKPTPKPWERKYIKEQV